MPAKVTGRLFVVATPIGNLDDLTSRAGDVLRTAEHILAEDTRRARILLSRAGSARRPVSYHVRNEAARTSQALRWLGLGRTLALVSDAGTPLVSDPGERLVRAAVEAGHQVIPVPGPSAVLAALVASGFSCVPFTFAGFLPRKGGKRGRELERIASARETTVLFEAPSRLLKLLESLAERAEPDRRLAVCRELTKLHEEVFRGTASEAARHFDEAPPKGEVTVVVEGRPVGSRDRQNEDSRSAALARAEVVVGRLLDQGLAPAAAAKALAKKTGLARGDAYGVVCEAKRVREARRSGETQAREPRDGRPEEVG